MAVTSSAHNYRTRNYPNDIRGLDNECPSELEDKLEDTKRQKTTSGETDIYMPHKAVTLRERTESCSSRSGLTSSSMIFSSCQPYRASVSTCFCLFSVVEMQEKDLQEKQQVLGQRRTQGGAGLVFGP
jgi:hypothetical protein